MTTAEAIAQIREALRAKYWLLQRPEDVEQAFAEALATLDFVEVEIERLRAVVEAAQGVYSPNDRWGYLTDDESLGAALAALEEPVIPGYGSAI